ncbi:inorganic triphosphatase YgiF [Bradyrhizobium sp. RT6a]
MELIVAGYVKVRDRRALTDLLAHRRKVLAELQTVSGINPENAVRAIQDELAVIEAGLEELKPPPGSLPENEWS